MPPMDKTPQEAPVTSHYLPRFTTSIGPLQRAICGAWIEARAEHSTEPTCPTCAAYVTGKSTERAL